MPSPGTSGGRVRIYIDGDAADLERAVKQSNSALARLGIGQQNLSTKTQLANAVADQQRRNLSAIATGAKYAAGGLAVFAGAGLVKATADGIRFNAQMESSELALKNLLGGSQEAKKYLDDLYETAKQTPFEFTDLTEASRRLISFGLDADKTKEILNATGDAVAAMGGSAENIDRVTLALGQMQAKGKVSAEELLQLTEAGIPAYKILQDELGLTGDQIADIGNQGIKADVAIDALTKGMEDRFGGMAAKQAKTWDGLTSTMKDNWAQMTGAMTTDLFGEAKQWAPRVNETMEDITSIFERKDLSFDEKVQKSIDAIDVNLGPLADEIGKQLDDAELGEHFVDAVEWAIPRVAENAGQLGLKVAEGMVQGWIHADPLGKLFLGASAVRMVAGNAGFSILGGAIAKQTGSAASAALPASLRTAASGVNWGPIGLLIAGGIAGGMEGAEGPLGLAMQRQVKRWTGLAGNEDWTANLRESIEKVGDGDYLDTLAADAKDAGHTLRVEMVKAWVAAGDVSEEQGERIIGSIHRLRQGSQDESFIEFSTTNKTFKANIEALHRGFATSMGGIRKIGKETSEEIESELGKGSAAGRRAMAANYRAMADNVDRLVERGVLTTRQGEKRKAELIENSNLVAATTSVARSMSKAWSRGLSDQEQFTKKHVDDVLDQLQRMPAPAANAASRLWLGQLREAAKNNPKLMDEFRDLRERIVDELGIAAVRGTKKAQDLQAGVGGSYRNTSWIGGKALGVLAENTSNFLTGVDQKPLDFTLKDVAKGKSPFQRGGAVRLQGGGDVFQVPGYGTGDSFHTVVPPNSFVLNREAVGEFFGLQRGGVPVVLEPGELVFGPEAVAQMGGWLQWANDKKPRLATGGSVAMPGTGVQRSYPGVSGDTDFIPALGNALSRMAKGTGQSISVQSGFRTYAEQAALQGGPNPAAAPGTSHHEYGYAADITPGNSVFGGVAGKYGLTFPLLGIGEPWHIELANPNSPAAKAVAAVAAAAIKRQVVDGPDGKLKDLSQAALDKAWKGAKDYVNKKQPAGAGDGPVSFPKGGAVDVGNLPPALQKWNKRFPGAMLQTDPGAWMGLTEMPFNVAAAIAEWAGMPGVTMAQVSKGEGSLKPGSMGDDNGDGKPDGYGWLAITRPYGDSFGVNKYGGYEGMLNPISNAIVAKGMYDAQGLGAWHGQRYVTDTNAHYSGPLLGKQRGGFVGMAKGGKPTKGSFDPTPDAPPQYGPALPGFPGGSKPGDLTYEQKMTVLGIALTGAEETAASEDDLKILSVQMRLIQGELDTVNDGLSNLHLTKDDRAKARRQAADATEAMRKKFMKDGNLSEEERRKLEHAQRAAMRDAGSDILSARRDDLLDRLSSLTGEMASTKDSIESLNDQAAETMSELAESMASLAAEMAEHNDLISRNQGVSNAELVRALADLLDGEIGGRVDAFSNTAGYGQVVAA